MKNQILLLLTIVWTAAGYSQEYWGTYLPDASGWPDYYNENLYSMDTSTAPNVIRIDPSLSDPDRDYDNIMEWAEDQWSFYVPSNTILVWKAGTSDTIKKTVYGDKRSLYLSGVENVFIGTYGGDQKVKLFTDMIESNKEDKVSSIDFFGGTDRVWIDNIEFSHTGTNPWWWKSGVGDFYRYSNAFDIGIHFNQSGMTDDTFEKTIISRVYFNGVGDNIISGDYAWNIGANTGAGTDTVVVVYCEDNRTLREGFTGEVFRARIYDNNWGSCNWEFLYDPNGYDDGHAGGDAIQLSFGASIRVPKYGKGNYYIQGNTINRQMGNKHTIFISDKDASGAGSDADSRGSTVIVKDNEMTPPRDTTGGGGSNFMRNITADSVYFINNRVWGGDYIPFDFVDHTPGQFYSCDGMRFTWFEGNIIENVTYLNFTEPGNKYWGGAPLSGTKTIVFNNNTFVNTKRQLNPNLGFLISLSHFGTMTLDDEWNNNLFMLNDERINYGGTGFYNNNGQLPDTSNCQFINGSSETWDDYFGISGWENHNLTPTENGRLHDNGTATSVLNKYSGLLNNTYDRNGTLRFSGDGQDIGALEYAEGVQSNLPPEILNQSFSVDENSPNNYVVGTVEATDPDAGQSLTFSIQSGNTGNAFYINSSTGDLSVATTSALNFEQVSEFNLTVKVQDNGPGYLSASATITVNLADVNEEPIIQDQSFSIEESIANGSLVGLVEATDPDNGQSLTWTITGGNGDGAFSINSSNGELTVVDNSVLNINTTPLYALTVEVEDNGTGNLSSDATVTVSLEEFNLAPELEDQSFTLDENQPDGTEVGTVLATDPNAGQTLTFAIISGNVDGAFSIGSTSGTVTVSSSDAINYEANSVFYLIVEVTDNGIGNLSTMGTVTINVNDINEPPVMNDQNFLAEEPLVNGDLIGVVDATDPDQGQSLIFSITGGNDEGIFSIEPTTGILTIADNSSLNFSQTPIYYLDMEVEDNGTGQLTDAAVIAISTEELNQAPLIEDQQFSIEENSTTGTLIGQVEAVDPDASQTLTYSIVSGNAGGTFAIGALSGELTVDNPSLLDYEQHQSFSITVNVEDDGIGNLSAEAMVTVNIQDINEVPVINDQYFSIVEGLLEGSYVGQVEAFDPDNGQSLTYSIQSGNTQGAFTVDASSGEITVSNSAALNMAVNPIFILQVEVEDNGSGNLTAQASVVIALTSPTAVGENISGEFDGLLYPNPATIQATLQVNNPLNEELTIQVIDFMGQVVHQETLPATEPHLEARLQLEQYKSGMYIVLLRSGDFYKQLKLIKQ